MNPILFKRRWAPNADGTDSTTALNDSNTVFVHTYQGDDLTGDGTRAKPFKTINKANQKSGTSYIVFRGVVNEYISLGKSLIGDDINQIIIVSNFSVILPSASSTFTIIENYFFGSDVNSSNILFVTGFSDNGVTVVALSNCFVNNFNGSSYNSLSLYNSLTINNDTGSYSLLFDCILSGGIVAVTSYKKYTNVVFSSNSIFKWNNIAITSPTWTNDSKANVQLLRNALVANGMTVDQSLSVFVIDSFGNETCKIIWEQRSGGTHPNIFNKYDENGNVLDFTLNPDPENEALFASRIGGYVGCFKAATPINSTAPDTLQSVINVNADGSDDTAAGTLVVQNADDSITFNTSSTQTWNRIKSATTITVPKNKKFLGLNIMSQDGSPFGYYFGKYQNIIDATALTPSSTLLANTWYKVCNAIIGTYQAINWNNTQYLPDYFFFTGSGPTSFTLTNSDSGTVVKKVLADPLESVDVYPYDTLITPSTFPIFSAPLMGNCNMLFYKAGNSYGKNAGTPVLFSDTQVAAISDKIAYYAAYAVTNADWEFVQLASDTTNYYYAPPALTYLRIEINAHFSLDYDQ